jgi:hypothetical protein
MAKRKPTPVTTPAADGHPGVVRICYERIVPDDVDPEAQTRRQMRALVMQERGTRLSAEEVAHVSRMALINAKKWGNGATLRCRFLDGTPKMRKKVEAYAHQWEQYGRIKFKFVKTGTAEIRISFTADPGSWSAVGRDALNQQYFPLHQPTMNYGWLRDGTDDNEYSRVVLHEFGHALGCIHEHSSPNFNRKWNVKEVMKYFQGPPNYWSAQDIQHNVLGKYSPTGVSATKYDPQSIMLYAFDGKLFSDGLGDTNSNSKASPTDIKMIRTMYP